MARPTGRLVDQIRRQDPIIKYGDPRLRQVSEKVLQVPDDMPEYVRRMEEIMRDANGVGLASPQLGILKRVIVYDVGDGLQAIVNPVIIRSSGEQWEPEEGCLSIPGLRGTVKRAAQVIVKGMDETGKPLRLRAEEYAARVIQHEVDHLDGILFIDRADPSSLHQLTAEELEEERDEDALTVGAE